MTSSDTLAKFPAYLHKHLENLCLGGRIGLSIININDITPIAHSDGWDDEENQKFHHFLMKIPYAGKQLKWEVLFDPEDLNFTPDFLFDEEGFPNNLNIDFIEKHLPSLNEWDLNDENALSRILSELLALYKMEHINRLKSEKTFQRYYEEFKHLTESENGIPKENFEVFVENTSTSVTLTFLISLKLDFSMLPDYIQTTQMILNPGPDFAHLKIEIQSDPLRGTFTRGVSLQFSPWLRQCLGKFEDFPNFSEEVLLEDYMAEVTSCIESRIELIKLCQAMKKEFMLHLVAMCSNTMLEYDTEKFQYVTFLRGRDDNKYMVKVQVEPNFPLEKPKVTIFSLFCIWPECSSNVYLRNFPIKPTDMKPREIAKLVMEDIELAIRTSVKHHHTQDEDYADF